MEELKYFDRIEVYVDGNMSSEDQQLFESELKTNVDLKTEYDAYLATKQTLEVFALEQISEELKSLSIVKENTLHDSSESIPSGRIISFPRRILGLAATLLLLIVAGTLWWSNAQYSDKQLARNNFITPNLSTVRGDANLEILAEASEPFYQGKYKITINQLQALDTSHPAYVDAQWLLGYAYLKNGQPQDALTAFQKVLKSDKDQLKASAEWHMILAYLDAGDQQAAEIALDELLQQPSGAYYSKAESLKKDLDTFWHKLTW